jgi:2-polyprenyl-3-methyl-5-hydroxy-6-metoxy-1,4-benzoquinol methylase
VSRALRAAMWIEVNCALCGANDSRPVTPDWQEVAGQRLAFSLVQCRNCGLTYVNPRLDRKSLTGTAGGGAWHAAGETNAAIYSAGIRRLNELLPIGEATGHRLLDVGCAYGHFLAAGRERGFDVTGLEIDKEVADAARRRGFCVYDAYLEDLRLPDASYEAITLWDVIEHVSEPCALLKEATRLLKPGGILFVHTGNAAFQIPKGRLLGFLRPQGGPYNAPSQHVTHWTVHTMRDVLKRAGGFDHVGIHHLDTIRYARQTKTLVMKAYNETMRLLHELGFPLWTTSLAAFARKARSGA